MMHTSISCASVWYKALVRLSLMYGHWEFLGWGHGAISWDVINCNNGDGGLESGYHNESLGMGHGVDLLFYLVIELCKDVRETIQIDSIYTRTTTLCIFFSFFCLRRV